MPDDETRRAADDPVSQGEPNADDTSTDDLAGGLSDAARGVIRQSADPRLDAHMARLLSDAPAEPRPREPDRSGAEVEELRAELEGAQRVVRILGWLLVVAIATIVLLLVLLVVR